MTQPSPTYCAECDNCERVRQSDPPWRWLCLKFPRLEGFGFVTKTNWDDAPPYAYCNSINHGACPLFMKKKEPPEQEKDTTENG